MKKYFKKCIVSLIVLSMFISTIKVDAESRTSVGMKYDKSLLKSVGKYDRNCDGYLSTKEIKRIKTLEINSNKTINLKNIKKMKYLTSLKVEAKAIKNLDEIRNLKNLKKIEIVSKKNKSIDLRKNKKLNSVTISMPKAKGVRFYKRNKIKYLNLSIKKNVWKSARQCKKLKELKLTGLDNSVVKTRKIRKAFFYKVRTKNVIIDNTDSLTEIYVSGANNLEIKNKSKLKLIDLRKCKFEELSFTDYKELKCLDIEECKKMVDLNLNNLPKLEVLVGWKNINVKELSLEGLESVKKINWSDGGLNSLSVAQNNNVERLYLPNNRIKAMDFSKLKKLVRLDISYNGYSGTIDFSPAESLKRVSCYNNNLAEIVAKNHKNLEMLLCSNNKLKVIDLSGSKKVECLECEDNPNVEIYLSNKFEDLVCDKSAVIHKLW